MKYVINVALSLLVLNKNIMSIKTITWDECRQFLWWQIMNSHFFTKRLAWKENLIV